MKRLDWKQEDLVGLEVPMLGKIWVHSLIIILKSASNLNGNLNCSKELEHYAS